MHRALLAELIGTFILVFAGTGAIVVDAVLANTHGVGPLGHVGIALTFGLVVTACIYALAGVSGCNINPAVSLAFAVSGRMPWRRALLYIPAQCAGALLASVAVYLVLGNAPGLGATVPHGSPMQSLVLEAILTFILMLVVLGSTEGGGPVAIAGIAIGGTVGLDALFGGPISGASMNPARSLGPAVVSAITGQPEPLSALWLYIIGPVIGALAATGAWAILKPVPPLPEAPSPDL